MQVDRRYGALVLSTQEAYQLQITRIDAGRKDWRVPAGKQVRLPLWERSQVLRRRLRLRPAQAAALVTRWRVTGERVRTWEQGRGDIRSARARAYYAAINAAYQQRLSRESG